MTSRRFTLTLSLLILVVASSTIADAQIKQVTFSFDAFCGNECFRHAKKTIDFYYKSQATRPYITADEDRASITIDHDNHQLTLFPPSETHLDLYDLRQELRNTERGAMRNRIGTLKLREIDVTVAGEVVDYIKTYSGGIIKPQKALKVHGTNQLFLLHADKHLQALIEEGYEQVTVSGKLNAFQEKHLPVLVIEAFYPAEPELVKTNDNSDRHASES